MPVRRPNLLDAFRRAHDVPNPSAGGPGSVPPRAPTVEPAAPAQPASTPAASTPAPVQPAPVQPAPVQPAPRATPPAPRAAPTTPARAAVEAPAPASSATSTPTTRIAPPADRPKAPPRERLLLLALALAIATLTLVLILRRDGSASTDTGVQAASAIDAPSSSAPQPTPAAAPTPTAPTRSQPDAELHDKRNRYTVRLIQYPNDKQGLALATEAYRWLVKYGYPVGSPILLADGRGIVLCADAKPTKDELVPLRDLVRRTRYPEHSKTMPFSDAYLDEIDDVLAR